MSVGQEFRTWLVSAPQCLGLSWKTRSLEGWSHLQAWLRLENSFPRWVTAHGRRVGASYWQRSQILPVRASLLSAWMAPDTAAGFPQNGWCKRQQGSPESFMTQTQKSHTIFPSHSICWEWVPKASKHSRGGEWDSTFWREEHHRICGHILGPPQPFCIT